MQLSWLVLLGLIASCSSFADFVYMREDASGKSVVLQTNSGQTQVLNDSHSKNWALYPDIAANGKEFIYVEGQAQSDLNLVYTNPTKKLWQKFLSPIKGMLLHPKFTKNGQFIFYSAPSTSGKNTIYYFDRAKEVARQGEISAYSLAAAKAVDASEESYFPRPSSDGNFVVYQRNANGKKEIVLYDFVENKKKVLAEGMSPALSFDERKVAFTAKKDGHWNIYILDRNTGNISEATNDKHDEMAPTFTKEGELVFASNKTGHYRLYQIKNDQWKNLVTINEDKVDLYSPNFAGEKAFNQSLKAPFIGNARSSFGTIMHEGKLYMAGGHQGAEHTYPPESFSDQFLVYDTETNIWTELAPRPYKAHGYQIAAYGNYIYAFGGFAYSPDHKPRWKSLDFIDRYNIKENKWETINKLFTPRSSNVAVTINGKVYLAGGWNSTPKFDNDYNGKFLDSIEVFDLANEKLELAPYKVPSPVRRALTGVEFNGKILLIGGLGEGASHFELLRQVTAIDPSTGESQELTPLPFATFAPAAGIIEDELFVFGGMFKTGDMEYEYVSHIYRHNFEQKTWGHTGRYLKETKGFSQVFNINEKTLGILGGHHYKSGMDTPVTTFETFQK